MCWQQQDPFSAPERKDDINCNRWLRQYSQSESEEQEEAEEELVVVGVLARTRLCRNASSRRVIAQKSRSTRSLSVRATLVNI